MAKKNKRLFIIDGYAILYRAHYALIRNPLITSYGFHTSALFGFSNHLIKIIKDENPDYLVCAFDSKEKNQSKVGSASPEKCATAAAKLVKIRIMPIVR